MYMGTPPRTPPRVPCVLGSGYTHLKCLLLEKVALSFFFHGKCTGGTCRMPEQISMMLHKNTITEVQPNTPGFYSNIFLVRKASGGWRPVIALKQLTLTSAHLTFICSL